MKHGSLIFLVLLIILALPQAAWANAGTPLMWASAMHLVFGNALIGVGEGFLLARLFSVPKPKSVGIMVLANYVSAWLGGVFLGGSLAQAIPMDLNNGWRWLWVLVLVTYCMTLLLEWPFVAFCFRGTSDWLRRSVLASVVVQSASYLLLFGWYWMASGTSLYTKMNIVAPADLSLPESVLVYFIAPADGNVYRRPLVGAGEQKILDLHSTSRRDRLFVRPNSVDPSRWDLMARFHAADGVADRDVEVLTNMSIEQAANAHSTETDLPRYDEPWRDFGRVPAIGDTTNSPWEFWTGFWPVEGLWGSNKATGERVKFCYETPFTAWYVRNAVHLPSDKVLFQLGAGQICAFDPVSRRVALLWHGRGPVAVIPETPAEPAPAANRRDQERKQQGEGSRVLDKLSPRTQNAGVPAGGRM